MTQPNINHHFLYSIGPSFMLIGLLLVGFGFHALKNAHMSLSWPSCNGIIEHSKVKNIRHTDDMDTYGIDICYNYTVDGKQYSGNNYRYGNIGTSDLSWARAVVAEYPVGATVKIYYSPDSPKESVLVPGTHFAVLYVNGLGAVFFLVGLLALIVGLCTRNRPGDLTPGKVVVVLPD